MAKADFLKERARGFLEDARRDLDEGKYALAAFYFEQVCQLYIKHKLFEKLADFPKTHSLRQLLEGLGRAYEVQGRINDLVKDKAETLDDLEEAYLSSRYFPYEFRKEQVEGMDSFVKELIKFLEEL